MAKFEFWAEVQSEIVDIPDEDLEGLDDMEMEQYMLKQHQKWIDRNLYGDWRKVE